MKKHIALFSIIYVLSSCSYFSESFNTHSATNYNIICKCELSDSSYLLTVKLNNHYYSIVTNEQQYKQLKDLNKFTIKFTSKEEGSGDIISIGALNSYDTTSIKRQLFKAEAKDIEDYKRRSRGSYTIIELKDKEGLIVVNTPSQEISNMLRIEDFNLYYYKDWDGSYRFDHIEEN